MRVAQVMLARGFGGAERTFVDLCRALAARGHPVLAIGDSRAVALAMLHGTPRITTLGLRCHGNWDLLARHRLGRQLRDFNPSVVQAHLARAALLAGQAAHAQGIVTLAKTHNLVDVKYYRDIDILVPTTVAQAQHLAAQGIAAEDIRPIPNFSAVPAAAAPVVPAGVPWRVKSVGRFVAKKGFAALLEAVAALRAAGIDLHLTLGGDGALAEDLRARAAHLGLSSFAHFPGWVEDVAAFLADADLFVLPSHDEPFGIVLLEAMARGVPIVTTPTAGPREILDAHSATFAVHDDAIGLAAAMRTALTDYAASQARAARALACFRERYTADVVTARYLEVYAELVERQPRRRQA